VADAPDGVMRRLRALALPLVVYAAAAAWFTWPLVSVGTDHVVVSPVLLNDVYLVLWLLSWVGRALLHDPLNLFDGNALHPTPRVIAASEHLLGDAPLFLPVWLATDNAVLALNVLIFASFLLSALSMHFLAWRWTGSPAAAWVAGAAFAFAPWRLEAGRPHLLQVQYLPLIAWGLDRVVQGAGPRVAVLTAIMLAWQVLCSYYLGYAAYLLAGVFVLAWLAVGEGRDDVARWRDLAIALLLPLVVIVPLSLPYLIARRSGGLVTDPTGALLHLWSEAGRPETVVATFCGWGATVLAGCGGAAALARWRVEHRQRVRFVFLFATFALAIALAAGPGGFAGGRVSPYTWLSALVPGFGSLRSPIRFGILAGLAASVLAAFTLALVERCLPPRTAQRARWPLAVIAVAAVVGWAVVTPPPQHVAQRVPLRADLSAAHRWLAQHGQGGPLLELPFDRALGLAQARAMFVSTYHWLPLLNGYTGYVPSASAFLHAHAQQLPSPGSLQLLVDCTGLRWILVHFATGVRRDAWRRTPGVRLVQSFPPDSERNQWDDLYEVTTPRAGACPGLFVANTTAAGHAIATVNEPRGTLEARVPPVVSPFRESRLALSLVNDGDTTWPATATDPRRRFTVAYSWEPAAGAAAAAWERILLPGDVGPGERIDLTAWLWAAGTGRVSAARTGGAGRRPRRTPRLGGPGARGDAAMSVRGARVAAGCRARGGRGASGRATPAASFAQK